MVYDHHLTVLLSSDIFNITFVPYRWRMILERILCDHFTNKSRWHWWIIRCMRVHWLERTQHHPASVQSRAVTSVWDANIVHSRKYARAIVIKLIQNSPIITWSIIMTVQNDEMLTRDEIFRNFVHPGNDIRQSGSPDIITCLSNNIEYSPDISLVYWTMIAINNSS